MANAKAIKRRNTMYASSKTSLAYDYSNAEVFGDYGYNEAVNIPQKYKVNEAVVTETVVVSKQSLPLSSIVGFALAAVCLIFSLMARVQFTQVQAETAELQSQLNELMDEKTKLTIAYESSLNLTEIENYAINVLGMTKPHSDQVKYINGISSDKAVVLNSDAENSSTDLRDSFLQYFTN